MRKYCLFLFFISSIFCFGDDFKVLVKNGGWCWFQDERAVFADDNTLFFGSVKSPEGDIDVTSWNIKSGEVKTKTLCPNFNSDDHAVPAFIKLSDGNLLALWSSHGNAYKKEDNGILFYTKTKKPADVTQWSQIKKNLYNGCYNNLFMLSNEGNRIYNFTRSYGRNPNWHYSDDNAETFPYGGRLLSWKSDKSDPKKTSLDGNRPYLKYASNNKDSIHFITTEEHPRGYDNSIYHGYIKAGKVYDSFGKEVSLLAKENTEDTCKPTDFTKIFNADKDNVAWTTDLHVDENGYPVAIFSVQKDAGYLREVWSHLGFDLRYYYARFTGEKWEVNQMAYAGESLYNVEPDYTGLVALVAHNPNEVYISTNSHPKTGRPLVSTKDGLRHYEIFRGCTKDFGKSWKWEAITENSDVDNIRPIVPISSKNQPTILLWLRGKLKTYCDYKLDVVGKIVSKFHQN